VRLELSNFDWLEYEAAVTNDFPLIHRQGRPLAMLLAMRLRV